MDRRLKERRNALRRELGRRRAVWFGCAGIAILVAAGWFWLRSSDELIATHIIAPVTVHVSAAEIEQALAGAIGTNLLRLNVRPLEGKLQSIPYVREAHVHPRFPDGIEVRLVEYEPFGVIQGRSEELWVIADDGRVLEQEIQDGPSPLGPTLVPRQEIWPGAGHFLPTNFAGALGLLELLRVREYWLVQHPVASVEIDTEAHLTMVLAGGPEVRMGDPTDLETKLQVAELVIDRWLEEGKALQYVDVQIWDRPVAMPRSD
ncbi:MAG: FtsQ-type POTRA domain-containing protein [Actinobacteria bacterium]|nr:FtsQ-type POTRA domain-containing protein [Actinomycetota bacterium]